MTGTIVVAGAASGGGQSHGGPAPDTGAIEADPNAPAYTLYDATAPKVLEGDVHEITLTIEEKGKRSTIDVKAAVRPIGSH